MYNVSVSHEKVGVSSHRSLAPLQRWHAARSDGYRWQSGMAGPARGIRALALFDRSVPHHASESIGCVPTRPDKHKHGAAEHQGGPLCTFEVLQSVLYTCKLVNGWQESGTDKMMHL